MAELQIGHRKPRSVLSAHFPVVIHSVAKSAYWTDLVKPVVWFVRTAVNSLSRSVAKSAYYLLGKRLVFQAKY